MTTDLAWLAGFLDGEGSFMVIHLAGKRLKALGGKYIAPRITLVNTDEPTLKEVQRILVDLGLPHHVSRRIGGVNKNGHKWADSWDIRVQGLSRCKRWCEILIPYLRTKKSQAQAMLALIESRLETPNGEGLTAGQLVLIEQLRNRRTYPHRLHA